MMLHRSTQVWFLVSALAAGPMAAAEPPVVPVRKVNLEVTIPVTFEPEPLGRLKERLTWVGPNQTLILDVLQNRLYNDGVKTIHGETAACSFPELRFGDVIPFRKHVYRVTNRSKSELKLQLVDPADKNNAAIPQLVDPESFLAPVGGYLHIGQTRIHPIAINPADMPDKSGTATFEYYVSLATHKMEGIQVGDRILHQKQLLEVVQIVPPNAKTGVIPLCQSNVRQLPVLLLL